MEIRRGRIGFHKLWEDVQHLSQVAPIHMIADCNSAFQDWVMDIVICCCR